MCFSYFVCIFCLFLFVSLFSCLLSKVRKKAVEVERMRKTWEKMREGKLIRIYHMKTFFSIKRNKKTHIKVAKDKLS